MSDLINKMTAELTSTLIPAAALVAYKSNSDVSGERFYVEMRKIRADGKMGAGMPVSAEFLSEIAKNYTDSTGGKPHGTLPAKMLFCDPRSGCERYIWWNLPRVRRMFFRASLGISEGDYHVPGVIYVAGEGSLNVFAFKGDRPNPDTKLYWGPFFNTTNGRVCLGTTTERKPLDPTFEQLIDYWERRFWCTEFTHLGGGGNPTKSNLVLVTKASAEKPFPENELQSTKMKLKDLL